MALEKWRGTDFASRTSYTLTPYVQYVCICLSYPLRFAAEAQLKLFGNAAERTGDGE